MKIKSFIKPKLTTSVQYVTLFFFIIIDIILLIILWSQNLYIPEGQSFLYAYQTLISVLAALITSVASFFIYWLNKRNSETKYKNFVFSQLEGFIGQALVAIKQYNYNNLDELFLYEVGSQYFYQVHNIVPRLNELQVISSFNYRDQLLFTMMIRSFQSLEEILNEIRKNEDKAFHVKVLADEEIKEATIHIYNDLNLILNIFQRLAPKVYEKCEKNWAFLDPEI